MFGGFVAGVAASIISRNRVNLFYSGITSAAIMGAMHMISGKGGPDFWSLWKFCYD